MTTTPNPQARALELLEIVGKATPGPWVIETLNCVVGVYSSHGEPKVSRHCRPIADWLSISNAAAIACLPDLASELRASIDRENAACSYAKRLAESMWAQHYHFDAPHWQPFDDLMGLLSQIDNMLTGMSKATAEPQAFTGRRTARGRDDIPTDAGVPPRDPVLAELERAERFAQECGGTIEYDDARMDIIGQSGPTGLHYPDAMCNDPDGRIAEDQAVARAIGQPKI